MTNITQLDAPKIAQYVRDSIASYKFSPIENDWQAGFLGCLLAVYREGLGRGKNDPLLVEVEKLLAAYVEQANARDGT